MNEELVQIRGEIERLKRRLLEQILAELQTQIRLREAKEQMRPLRIFTVGDPDCGLIRKVR